MNGYSNGGASMIGSQKAYDESGRKIKMANKKPGFFQRWFIGQLQSVQEYENQVKADVPMLERGIPNIDQPERAIQFTVYTANGGRVVETRRYDRQKDRGHNNLYIISNDQDFGKEIDKIITMEALR